MYDVSAGVAMPPPAWPEEHVSSPLAVNGGPPQTMPQCPSSEVRRGALSVTDVVADLWRAGWRSHRDLSGQGRSRTEIDYVIVGSGGIFVVDSHSWSPNSTAEPHGSRTSVHEDMLLDVQRVTGEVRGLLPPLTRQYVVPVLVHVDTLPMSLVSHGVYVCTTATLKQVMDSHMKVLSPYEVDHVEASLTSNFVQGAARTEALRTAVRDDSAKSRIPSKESRAERRAAKKAATKTARATAEPEPVAAPIVIVPSAVVPLVAAADATVVDEPQPASVETPASTVREMPDVEQVAPAVVLSSAPVAPPAVSALPQALTVPLNAMTAPVYAPHNQAVADLTTPALDMGSRPVRVVTPAPVVVVASAPALAEANKEDGVAGTPSLDRAARPPKAPAEPKPKGPPVWKELTVLVLLAAVIGYGGIHHEAVTAWISEHVKSSPVEPSGPEDNGTHKAGDRKDGTLKHDKAPISNGDNHP